MLINTLTKLAWGKSHGAASVGSLEKLFLLLGVTYHLYIDRLPAIYTNKNCVVVKPEHVLKCFIVLNPFSLTQTKILNSRLSKAFYGEEVDVSSFTPHTVR